MLKNIWNTEPTMIVACVHAFLVMLLTFGVHLTGEQIGSIEGFLLLAFGLLLRSQVHSKTAVESIKAEAGKP